MALRQAEVNDNGPPEGETRGWADLFRERTRSLHAEAERSGIVHDILRGRATLHGYALYLRNLLPAYRAMEDGFARRQDTPWVRAVAHPSVLRVPALESDLVRLSGAAWHQTLTLLPAGERYARRVAAAADGDAIRLVAHAYTRYLADLNGGQALRRTLSRSLDLEPAALAFYDFPDIGDRHAFIAAYRDAIDRAGADVTDIEPVLEEAAAAFRHNIQVSIAVRDAAARPPSGSAHGETFAS